MVQLHMARFVVRLYSVQVTDLNGPTVFMK